MTKNSKKKQKEFTFFLYEPISDQSLKILPELYLVSKENPDSLIKIYLTSPGGDESAGTAIFDFIQAMPNEVHIYGYGQVCSIAALILQAGSKRFLSRNSQFMIHNGSMEMQGHVEYDMLQKVAGNFKKTSLMYRELIAKRSNIDIKNIEEFCNEERFFSAEECVALGFADDICEIIE